MKGNLNLGIELSHQSTNLNSIFPAITKQSYIGISESKDINEYTNISGNYSCEVTASTHRRIRMHILAICSPFYDFLLALDMTFVVETLSSSE